MIQIGLGVGGLVVSLLLAWALVATTRRQTAHFRSLVKSSTDLVLVLGDTGAVTSASRSRRSGVREVDLLGDGFCASSTRRPAEVAAAERDGRPQQLVFRLRNATGEWRAP